MPPSSTTPTPSKPSRYLTLPLPILLLLTLSLSIATLVCTTKTLNLFYHPQPASPWQPFDLQLLEAVRVTSILIIMFDVLIVMVVTGLIVVSHPPSPSSSSLSLPEKMIKNHQQTQVNRGLLEPGLKPSQGPPDHSPSDLRSRLRRRASRRHVEEVQPPGR